jgi:hypothetical protein
VEYVECLERGRKVSGLMGLIPIKSNEDVILSQYEKKEKLQSEKEKQFKIEWDILDEKNEDLTKKPEYNAINLIACQTVWLRYLLILSSKHAYKSIGRK